MDIRALGLMDIINPEGVNKENFKFITTIKYEAEIANAGANLKHLLGVDYFSICLTLPNSRKQIISNNPGNIAIPYQINGLHRLDNVFALSSHNHLKKDFFTASQVIQDECSNLYARIMNERFNVFNTFGFNRSFDGYEMAVVFAQKKETEKSCFNSTTANNMLLFVNDFINLILPCYTMENMDLKYSRFGQDQAFRKNYIYGKYKRILPELTSRELECLFWARLGKSTNETADILGLKRPTVKHYLESVRDKFAVSAVQEAITLAIQHKLIS